MRCGLALIMLLIIDWTTARRHYIILRDSLRTSCKKLISYTFSDFLLEDKKYMSFKIKVELFNISQIKLFWDFVENIVHLQSLEFDQVTIVLDWKYPKPSIINSPFKALVKRGMDYSCIRIVFKRREDPWDKSYEGALEYTNEL